MNTKPAAHTPTPWMTGFENIEPESSCKHGPICKDHPPLVTGCWLKDANDKWIAAIHGEHLGFTLEEYRANAAFIVRAVNAHEELLQLAKDYRGDLINHLGKWTAERIAELIARAEGRS